MGLVSAGLVVLWEGSLMHGIVEGAMWDS